MASEIFKRVDISYLVQAFSQDATHAWISSFELSVGIDTLDQGSKQNRAARIIKYIYDQEDTDALIIGLLDHLYLTNPSLMREENSSYKQLAKMVLEPRGITFGDDGFILPDGRGLEQLRRVKDLPPKSPAPANSEITLRENVTETPSIVDVKSQGIPVALGVRARDKVFVVHGKDLRPVDALKKFLLFLGLHTMSWSEAVSLTGKSQPHTYDVVKAGMDHAAAILVVFSPDDLAHVKDEYSSDGDPDRNPQGQARQNVTLEAGMAFAMAPERTIFLKSEATREISDIAGFNWVNLDGTWDSREDLKNRLTKIGAAISDNNQNLKDSLAGPFSVVN